MWSSEILSAAVPSLMQGRGLMARSVNSFLPRKQKAFGCLDCLAKLAKNTLDFVHDVGHLFNSLLGQRYLIVG
jgi:hypothetical protein